MDLNIIVKKYNKEVTERIVEKAVGELARGIYRMQINDEHEKAFHTLGVILDMILDMRNELRVKIGHENKEI